MSSSGCTRSLLGQINQVRSLDGAPRSRFSTHRFWQVVSTGLNIPPRREALQGFSMAKPLRTDDPTPQNMQFAHFGVLNDGSQSKGSLFTSVALNILLALCAIIIGAAAKKTIDNRHKLTHLDRADSDEEARRAAAAAQDQDQAAPAAAGRQDRAAQDQAARRQAARRSEAARDQDGPAAAGRHAGAAEACSASAGSEGRQSRPGDARSGSQ